MLTSVNFGVLFSYVDGDLIVALGTISVDCGTNEVTQRLILDGCLGGTKLQINSGLAEGRGPVVGVAAYTSV